VKQQIKAAEHLFYNVRYNYLQANIQTGYALRIDCYRRPIAFCINLAFTLLMSVRILLGLRVVDFIIGRGRIVVTVGILGLIIAGEMSLR